MLPQFSLPRAAVLPPASPPASPRRVCDHHQVFCLRFSSEKQGIRFGHRLPELHTVGSVYLRLQPRTQKLECVLFSVFQDSFVFLGHPVLDTRIICPLGFPRISPQSIELGISMQRLVREKNDFRTGWLIVEDF